MAGEDQVRLTQSESVHQDVMRSVAERMHGTGYVLKGGTALLLTQSLDRHSTDLDFDARRRRDISRELRAGIEAAGGEITSMREVKATDTAQRIKIHYTHPDAPGDNFLKIDGSFRNPERLERAVTVDGIKTYPMAELLDQKLHAANVRDRGRDLYDIAHLAQHHGKDISDRQLAALDRFSADIDGNAVKWQASIARDGIVNHTDSTTLAVTLRDNVEKEMGRRLLAEIQQDLAKIDETIAKVADPAARVQLEVGRAQLQGTVADLTGDRQTSERYGSQAPQVPIGAQDLAEHGARVRERFDEASRAISDEVSRVGLDLTEIGARLSMGRAVPQGLVKDWEDRDLLAALATTGKTLETASEKDFDQAVKSVEGVQSKILDTFQQVIKEVRQDVRHEIERARGTQAPGDDTDRRRRAQERASTRDDGVSL